MGLELVEFDERTMVEQEFDAFAGRHPPGVALALEAVFAAGQFGLARQLMDSFDIFLKPHRVNGNNVPEYDATAHYINYADNAERRIADGSGA